MFILGVLVAVAIFIKCLYVQYGYDGKWQNLSATPTQRHIVLEANRGNIYAQKGALISTSIPYYKVAIDPSLPSDYLLDTHLDTLCYLLATYFKENTPIFYKNNIKKARKAGKRYLPLIRKEIDHAAKESILDWPLLSEGRWVGGVILEKVPHRFLPFGSLARRTLGYLNNERQGVVGLECSFDRVLRGINGRVLIERSIGGGWYPLYDGSETYPSHGSDLRTTLDMDIQEVAHGALLSAMYAHDASYGCALVMDVRTGEIKAMVNFGRKKSGHFVSNYNYAVGAQGVVEPGSTFKLATVLALLEQSNMKLTDTVQTGAGIFNIHGVSMKDDKKGGWGLLTATEAFERSSNIGVAKLALRHFGANPQVYTKYLRDELHLNDHLGFQLKGEGKSHIKTPLDASWSGTSLAWMAHGYEVALSPMQLLTLYNAVANDGRMVVPLLVSSIENSGKKVEHFQPRVVNERIASKQNVARVQTLLEGVVRRGTARNIYSPHYRIAGKTGTAKKYENGKYVDQYQASFAGYFPADAPQYSCVVVINNPRRGGTHGAVVAAPVFRKIADKIVRRGLQFVSLRTPEGLPRIGGGWSGDIKRLCDRLDVPYLPTKQEGWVRTLNAGSVVAFRGATSNGKTPDMRGMLLRDALYLAENMGFRTYRVGSPRRGLLITTTQLYCGASAGK